MRVYGETICVGIDLKEFLHERPRNMSAKDWWEQYNGLWPNYIDCLNHHFLGLFMIPVDEDLSIALGCRMEYYLANYADMPFNRFRAKLAREIGRVLRLAIKTEDIKYFSTNYILEVDEDDTIKPSEESPS